jgi:hypothetical protein
MGMSGRVQGGTVPQESRCVRCSALFRTPPYLMAGRAYCCQSCSVGSACAHQGVARSSNVRRYDSNFDGFRQSARSATPYEPVRTERNPGV